MSSLYSSSVGGTASVTNKLTWIASSVVILSILLLDVSLTVNSVKATNVFPLAVANPTVSLRVFRSCRVNVRLMTGSTVIVNSPPLSIKLSTAKAVELCTVICLGSNVVGSTVSEKLRTSTPEAR